MDKKEYALQLKHSGCNCCQAVLLAFSEEMGMTEDALKSLGAAFGGGMGCMEGTCGALVGAEMVAGIKKYQGKPMHKNAAEVLKKFEAMCQGTICKDIKGIGTGIVLCSCDDCVKNAVEIIEELG